MRARAPLFVGVGVLVLVIGVVVLVVLPRVRAVGEARDRLAEAEEQEVGLRVELARLEQAQDAAAGVRRELARLRREVPPVADLPGLINQLQDSADASGVEFFSVSPGAPVPTTGAARITSEIRVNGGFFAVDEFLFRLENLNRAAKVTSLSITESAATAVGGTESPTEPTPSVLGGLQVTMTVEFYTKDLAAGPGASVVEPEPTPTASPSPGTESPAPEEGA